MSYTVLTNGSTITSAALNGNFYHVAQGDFLPMGGTSMTPTTGVYDLGSAANHWRRGYWREFAGNTITVSAPMTVNGIADIQNISLTYGFLGYFPALQIQQILPTGTVGGTGSSTFTKRLFNTITVNSIAGASMTSSQISLPIGVYICKAHACYHLTATASLLQLQNITASITVDIGIASRAHIDQNYYAVLISNPFTVTTLSVFEIQQWINTADGASRGLGAPAGALMLTQMKEQYAEAEFIKIG